MIEAKVIKYLSDLGIPTFAEEPINKQNEYVVIRLVDDGRTNQIDYCSIYFQCKARTMVEASELCTNVRNKMFEFTSCEGISSSKCSGGGQNLNTQSKQYCYETVFTIVYAE